MPISKSQIEQVAADLGHSLPRFQQHCVEAVTRMILADSPKLPNVVRVARLLREQGLSMVEADPIPQTHILHIPTHRN